ncbi:MAG: hypothetical protein IT178_08180 [Acidobacteria bacterium]|nr:hypothetical protein [Acidobacteriota bacterium]
MFAVTRLAAVLAVALARPARICAICAICGAGLAGCRADSGTVAAAPAAAETAAAIADIKHLHPAPDSIGPQPSHFAWSPVKEADSYTFRIWNEADVRVVSESGLLQTDIEFPSDSQMPAGTYFWAVVGMRGDVPVAESGLAAFVVRQP